jgi:signal transduction histidine kinase
MRDRGSPTWYAGTARVNGEASFPGVGIAPEVLPGIFDLFTQADRSLDRSRGGLGIGLSLVRSLVELHHGRVEARSAGYPRSVGYPRSGWMTPRRWNNS